MGSSLGRITGNDFAFRVAELANTGNRHDFRYGSRLCENLADAMIPVLNRGGMMKGFVQGADRQQTTLLPECLDDWVDESNPVRAVDVFVDALLSPCAVSWGCWRKRTIRRCGLHSTLRFCVSLSGELCAIAASFCDL
jgi:hypothetical protein